MLNAVLFKSEERFLAFKKSIEEHDVNCFILDFADQEWIEYDYSDTDFIIYYPSFKYTSSYPLALLEVYDNLMHIKSMYPNLKMYPEPKLIEFYNDKYKQYLFLKRNNYPIPLTYPLFSEESIKIAEEKIGYPMVIKNRFGAGGGFVFNVFNKKELKKYYNLSTFNFINFGSVRYILKFISNKRFYYHLIKKKRMPYPFLSPPLLAQKFVKIDRDLKTVVGNNRVVESHWRLQAYEGQWKVNIDDGGIGVWSKVPQEAIDLSIRLAKDLKASWVNIDLLPDHGQFLITEFSPVWHHYAYKEKPSFVYKDDYNIETPLEFSLDLEKIIVESLLGET